MQKIFNIGIIVLGILCLVLWILLSGEEAPYKYTDIMFYISYFLLAVALVSALAFSVINIVSSSKKLKTTAIGVGAFILVLVIGYVIAQPDNIDFSGLASSGIEVSEETSKNVGAGLWVFYILGVVAVLAMVFSGVKKMFK